MTPEELTDFVIKLKRARTRLFASSCKRPNRRGARAGRQRPRRARMVPDQVREGLHLRKTGT